MFSSLPSASKIYVSSTKSRQKNLNSAKKKRKKIVANNCSPVHIQDEDTLVSKSTLRKSSASQISFNSHQESLDVEESTGDEDTTLSDSVGIKVDIVPNTVSDGFESETVNENNISDSSQVISTSCVDETLNTQELHAVEEQNSNDSLHASTDISYVTTDCDTTSCSIIENTCIEMSPKTCSLETTSEAALQQCVDSSIQTAECLHDVNQGNPVIAISSIETDNEPSLGNNENVNHTVSNRNEPSVGLSISTQTTLSDENVSNNEYNENDQMVPSLSTQITFSCEKDEILSENLCIVSNESKGLLGDNLNSDLCDNASVRSDYCVSTNIYHELVDNSEHSSLDDNDTSGNEVEFPSQSEGSYTESMHNVKNSCQTESALNSSLTLSQDACEQTSPHCSQQISSDNLTDKVSNSITDLQTFKTNEMLTRSVSLPDAISKSKSFEQLSYDVSNFKMSVDINSKESTILLDKNTSTLDIRTLDQSTVTDIDDHPNCKIDAATTPIKENYFKPTTKNSSVSTSFRDNTTLIMKVLPPVAIMQARARSYVFGSVGPTGSLLGNEELTRLFPDSKVTVFVGTWNMNGHDSPDCIDDFLLPLEVSCVPDIYAVGVQESMQSRSEWEILLQTTLGPSHVLFASTSFGVLHLSIFMRRDLIWFCSEPEEANIATRPGSMIKTKGAVAICFMFFGTSFLFVNSHLTAHEQKLKERLSDYEKICSSLDLPKQIPLRSHQKGKDVTSRFDCVFWCGDLNFRVTQDRPSVLSFVEEKIRQPEPSCNLLMKHDQLSQAMAKGKAFHGFNEGVINFIPSYKFDVGTSCFDSTKHRVPSYTDRILYRSREKLSVLCLHYNAAPEIFTSDHKPVFAIFSVCLKPGRDNIPLAAGLFKRDIYLEAIKRRARQLEITRSNKQSTVCSVM